MIRSFVLCSLLITQSLWGAELLTVQESVESRIVGVTADKFELLKKQHAASCDQWVKGSYFHFFRAQDAQSSQCSKAKFEKTYVTKSVWECWTQIHPVTGQSIEYCDDVTKTEHVGYRGQSTGTRVLQINEEVGRREEELSSDSFVGDAGKAQAWTDYLKTCEAWLKGQKSALGSKLVFAGCRGAEQDTVKVSSGDGIFRYDSKAVVVYLK